MVGVPKGFRTNAGVQGWVRVRVNDELAWEGSNLVTNVGLAYCATLLGVEAPILDPMATPSTAYESIDLVRIGNGGSYHLINYPTIPVPPQRTQTALLAEITQTVAVTANPTVSGNTVTYVASAYSDDYADGDFPATDGAVGPQKLFVNEASLVITHPTSLLPEKMFARVTFPSIAFAPTSGTTLSLEWIVGYL